MRYDFDMEFLCECYAKMAANEARECEALEWTEALIEYFGNRMDRAEDYDVSK